MDTNPMPNYISATLKFGPNIHMQTGGYKRGRAVRTTYYPPNTVSLSDPHLPFASISHMLLSPCLVLAFPSDTNYLLLLPCSQVWWTQVGFAS
eukprot:6023520-Amphidinium_carterae.1